MMNWYAVEYLVPLHQAEQRRLAGSQFPALPPVHSEALGTWPPIRRLVAALRLW